MSTENIRDAIEVLLRWLRENSYSDNTIAFYRSRCKAVLEHAEQTGTEVVLKNLADWADSHTEGKSNSIACCMRRVLVMLDCIVEDKPLPQGNVGGISPLTLHDSKFAETVGAFRDTLLKRDLASSTVRFSVYCANHFLSHLESHSSVSIAEITKKHVTEYLLFNGQGFESSTKRAMVYRLKQFLEYLYAERLSGENLALCVSTDFAIRKKLVSILPDDAQKALLEWSGGFSSARQARDYAICMLAFRLMLRQSDIISLKLADIDWNDKKISIIQKKTKLPLVLPLPDDVGNALAEYILDFRQESEFDEVFLRTAFPIRPLNSLVECLGSALRWCGYTGDYEGHGVHVLRRTGASNLLRAGVSTDKISILLGHQNISTVDPYLSMDEKRMLLCCGDFRIPGFRRSPNEV
jgi:site-specific recombinase XerD